MRSRELIEREAMPQQETWSRADAHRIGCKLDAILDVLLDAREQNARAIAVMEAAELRSQESFALAARGRERNERDRESAAQRDAEWRQRNAEQDRVFAIREQEEAEIRRLSLEHWRRLGVGVQA